MLKRILASILSIAMFPTISAYTVSAADKEYDASIFGNNAEYLLEDHFETFIFEKDGKNYRHPSGWDVDYRGGQITTSGYTLYLSDTSTTEEISLKREILPVKSGEVVYETAVTFSSAESAEFSLFLGDEDNYILNLYFNKQKVYNVTENGKEALTNIKAHVPIYVKAKISMDKKKVELYIDNTSEEAADYSGTVNFANNVSEWRDVSFHTGKKSAINTKLHFVNIYKNYMVNEKFMTDPIGDVPEGFVLSQEGTGSGIADAPGSTYRDDENGFLLKNTTEVPEVSISTSFANTNKKTTASWTMLMPEVQNGFYARLASDSKPVATIYTDGGNLYANGTLIESGLAANLWYTVSVDVDTQAGTYDVMLNTRTVAEGVELYNAEIPTKLSFAKTNSTIGEMLIDDIEVTPAFEKYSDYPEAPVVAESDGVNTAMVMYSMWREGTHNGWDTISPYSDERKPLMGYYTEGQREVADWQNKWLAEHGIDYAIYPFVRPSEYKVADSSGNYNLTGEPIKAPVRGEDLLDGYMNSYYKDDVKFAIMLSMFSKEKYKDADDFVTYVVPYIKEYFFKNPNYMKINNKLPVFNYSIGNMSNAVGGYTGIQKIADALDAAAKDLGYDGIIFGADAATSTGHNIVNNINRDYVRIWNYTKTSGNVGSLKSVIDSEYSNSSSYIPSISTGYDDTPWRESSSDMMSADDVKELCGYVKNHASFKAEDEKMVVFTCWNEYGEGHFFAPSAKEGFGYLNAIRQIFTESGIKTNEETPTGNSVARMEVLYPNGRGALKILNDKEYSAEDIASREVLYRYEFDSASANDGWSPSNCTISMSDSGVKGTTTNTNPWIQCEFGDTGVPLSEVRALKIKMYQKGAPNMQVFYHTTDYDKDSSIANEWGEFFISESISGSDEYSEYILQFNSEAGKMTGNISMIRLRFGDATHSSGGKEFGVEYFELLGDSKKTEPVARIEFGLPDSTGNCIAQEKDGAILAQATGNDAQLRYTNIAESIDISKVKAVKIRAFTQGTNDLIVYYGTDGNVTYQHSPYKFSTKSMKGDGSYREYVLTHDSLGSNAAPTGNITSLRIDPNDNIYENGEYFGIDWIEFYDEEYDETYPITLTVDGEVIGTTAPIQENVGIAYVPVYSILLKELDAYVVWDEANKTLTVEKGGKKIEATAGKSIATVNGKKVQWSSAPYYEKGNLFVPGEDFFEAMGYAADYSDVSRTITCISETEQEFSVGSYEERFDKNIAIDFWSASKNDYFINGSSTDGSNLSNITELVDGENAIKITPPNGAGTDALFVCRYVNYNGSYMTLKNFVAKGTRMKVSFSYKGVGTALEVDSREAGGGNTQKAPSQTISSTEWKTFEYEFDNSIIPVTSESRWISLRLKSASGTVPYLYVKDFTISYPEAKAITQYDSSSSISFTLNVPTGQRNGIPYNCYVAEYDGNELVNVEVIKSGDTSNAGEYITRYDYTPKTGDSIKVFLWSSMEPILEATVLSKNQ